jgi:catechol 2,3-dioxygenase-like lactoylglutathione lyase family enzyme
MGQSIVNGIQSVYLPVTNPKKSADWYASHLGLRLLRPVDGNAQQAQLGFPEGQTLFLIQTREKETANFKEINGTIQCPITIQVSDIDQLYKQLRDSGANIDNLEDNGDCGVNFYIYDPDGNKIDIWGGWPKPLQNNSKETGAAVTL